jgi:hypothetical protein
VRTIWNGRKPDVFNVAELLTTLAIYHVYKQDESDDYLENVNKRRLPWVLVRDIKGTVTRDVIKGFDALFQESLNLLRSAWSADKDIRNEIKARIESGEFNPALNFVNDPRMKNAVGMVLMRQIDVREGLIGKEAFELAAGKLDSALKEIEKFVSETIMFSSQYYVQEMQSHSLRPMDINALDVKIIALDEMGPVIEMNVDEGKVYLNDQREEVERQDGGPENNNDPMYG